MEGAAWLASLAASAAERERSGLRRHLRPRGADDDVVDLAGNDYLGFARHPEVIAAAAGALKSYGLGATGSRLVRGSTELHGELEGALAAAIGAEAALVYSSGYLANLGAVRGLASAGTLIASDSHNHASLVDGCRIASAGRTGSRTQVYDHASVFALADALAGAGVTGPSVAVTESIFSVRGDLAPLAPLHRVARDHGAVLLVDDAHGFGLVGPGGAGGVAAAGLSGQPDVVVTVTLSKALGAGGGAVAGPAAFIRHLVETSRTFIYDTGLPPTVAAGALAALRLVTGPAGEVARAEVIDRAAVACAAMRRAGFDCGEPAGGVLAVGAPGPDEAVAWANRCRDRGVAVGCFRPPSTPDGSSALRLTINAGVAREDFDRAIEVVVACAP